MANSQTFSELELVLLKIFSHEIDELIVADLAVVIQVSLRNNRSKVELLEHVEEIFVSREDTLQFIFSDLAGVVFVEKAESLSQIILLQKHGRL